jgi:hypothetical protein
MKKSNALLMAALLSTSLVSSVYAATSGANVQETANATTSAVSPEANMNDVSYVIGYQIGNGIKTQKMDIDPASLKSGLNSALEGKEAKFTQAQMQTIMENFQKEMMAKAAAAVQDKASSMLK